MRQKELWESVDSVLFFLFEKFKRYVTRRRELEDVNVFGKISMTYLVGLLNDSFYNVFIGCYLLIK